MNNVFKPATANNNLIRQSASLVPSSVLPQPTSQPANSSTVQQQLQQPPIQPQTGNNQNQTGNNQNNQNLNLMMMQQQQQFNTSRSQNRPKPISCTPPPFDASGMHSDKCDYNTIQQTCSLFGLDLVSTLLVLECR